MQQSESDKLFSSDECIGAEQVEVSLRHSGSVKTAIMEVLDQDLPAEPYPVDLFNTKVAAVYDHVLTTESGPAVPTGSN